MYTADPKKNINPFSMRLQVFVTIGLIVSKKKDFFFDQGIIDANVMGGISKYQQAFFITEFAQQHPEWLPFVQRLKALLLDQVNLNFAPLKKNLPTFSLINLLGGLISKLLHVIFIQTKGVACWRHRGGGGASNG